MTIIEKSRAFTPAEIFKLTKDGRIEKLNEHEGEVLTVTGYIIYTDKDSKGDEKTILSMETDDGAPIATNSPTAQRSFMDILEIYRESGEENPFPLAGVTIISGKAKSGRTFYDISLA